MKWFAETTPVILQLQRILAFDHFGLPLKQPVLFLNEFAPFLNESGLLLHQAFCSSMRFFWLAIKSKVAPATV